MEDATIKRPACKRPACKRRARDRSAWRLAWLCLVLAVPLRLYFFSGYGLGDDHIFITTAIHAADRGRLDFADHRTNRLLLVIPQALAFKALGVDDFSFVLPIFVFALGTHALVLLLARQLLGAGGALVASLLVLATPLETLTGTAFSPDHVLAFYSVAAAWCCYRGFRSGRIGMMILGGVFLVCCFLTKISAILMLPVFGLATLIGLRHWRGWLAFWSTFAVGLLAIGLLYWTVTGNPLDWVERRAHPPWGHDVTDILARTLLRYPTYLFWKDPDHGTWIFGLTGWLAAAGMAWGLVAACARRRLESVFVVLVLCYLLLFNFTPHKLDFTAYYSHPRIFRYLDQVAPFLYVAAAYLVTSLWRTGSGGAVTAALALTLACGFGLYQTPRVTEPSWDANADGRALTRFFRENATPRVTEINGDSWNCQRLQYVNHPQSKDWRFRCKDFLGPDEKRAFLEKTDFGFVVTGGGSLDWYSNHTWVLDLEPLGFTPPDDWKLVYERPAPVTPWRSEPLRIWKIEGRLSESVVPIADAALEQCLREQVFPLRPEDGLAADAPIVEGLARIVQTIECRNRGITDAAGLERFVNVEVLNLAGNRLERIDLSSLTALKVVVLGGNRLTEVKGTRALREATLLWLGFNRLTHVDVTGLERLRDLRLDHNDLADLRGSESLTALESLFLSENPRLDCDRLAFPPALMAASGCGK